MSDLKKFDLTPTPLNCGHCTITVRMYIICTGERHAYDQQYELRVDWTWQTLICPGCLNVTFIQSVSDSEHEVEDVDRNGVITAQRYAVTQTTLYPSARRRFQHLPPPIEKSYQSAVRLMLYEPIACAVFVGRTLEHLCHDRQAQGKSLDHMLRDLAHRGELPPSILDMALSLKYFRNLGAHASELDLSHDDASLLIAICEVILEYVYEAAPLLAHVKTRIAEVQADNQV